MKTALLKKLTLFSPEHVVFLRILQHWRLTCCFGVAGPLTKPHQRHVCSTIGACGAPACEPSIAPIGAHDAPDVQRKVLKPRTMRYISHAHINPIDNPPQGLHP